MPPLSETGRAVTYLGVVQTDGIQFRQAGECGDVPGHCVELNPAPSPTSVSFADLGTIELAAGATNSLICFTLTPIASMNWHNPTGSPQQASANFSHSITIENDALQSIVDPNTGLPLNGVLVSGASTLFESWRMDAGESYSRTMFLTRSCIGGFVSARFLELSFGMSETEIRDFFSRPMTVRIGVQGSASLLTGGSYSVGVRLYGD